ncbi:MAG: MBL fold metallo-hydrolase [Clostridium sp.]|nr:MBL fold metallo-hydrolase [Clostridium sp.]
MGDNGFKITYLFHSGFLVECSRCYYLFDYYRGTLPPLNPDKPILVFVSHSHPDHYNPKIFEMLAKEKMTQVTAIFPKELSKKIAAKKGSSKMAPPENIGVVTVTFHNRYELPCETYLETLQSTDIGVAFVLKCPDGILYHGGDLNDWVRSEQPLQYNKQMTGSYRHEINLLATSLKQTSAASMDTANVIDAAFLPLDPLLKENYAKGMLYFLQKIPVKKVYPMHYWGEPEIIETFLREYPEYQGIIQRTESFASST